MSKEGTASDSTQEARRTLAGAVRQWHAAELRKRSAAYEDARKRGLLDFGGGISGVDFRPLSFEDLCLAIERGEVFI